MTLNHFYRLIFFWRPTTVAGAVAGLRRAVQALHQVSQYHDTQAAAKTALVASLSAQIGEHQTEVTNAARIAANLEALIK